MLRGLCVSMAAIAACRIEPRGAGDPEASPVARPLTPASFLAPLASVSGGFSLAPVPAPGARLQAPGPFIALRGPITAAARGTDLYIADAGHDAVFHCDVFSQQLRRLPGTGARPGVKLCVLGDRSVVILDPMRGRLLRVSRDGRQLARLQDPWLLAGARDLALEDPSGVIWLADSSAGRVLAVRPAFNAVLPVPLAAFGGESIGPLTALVTGFDALYAVEPARTRVLRLDAQGRVMQAFGEGVLRQPRALAADRYGRVYVVDGMDRSLHIFRAGRHEGSLAAQSFGVTEFSDVRVHDDELAIADAVGGRVQLFRVLGEG
ncbi:MAG: hypothetical protein HY017_24755 [Betaproteobacteria bacterium]|nr:hypothetical protein [Betaproteobacteria bacterium]